MRDRLIDGFRAIAVLGVVLGHAANYRYASVPWLHYAQRLPISDLGVQIFFVISGFIITSLLLREEAKTDRVNIPAFYARRTFRIIPPFALMLAFASADGWSKAHAATFTCNIFECEWGVAHSWSLAVEEQFYILWPLLFVLLRSHRTEFLIATIFGLLATFLLSPDVSHSNAHSFACIATGALLAVQPTWRIRGQYWTWGLTAAALLLMPLMPLAKPFAAAMPFLVAYLLFGARDLAIVRVMLESVPFQWIGLCSYSLYLWQQPFLSKESQLPIWLLPAVVAGSVFLVEKPFNRLGHALSAWFKAASSRSRSSATPVLPAPAEKRRQEL